VQHVERDLLARARQHGVGLIGIPHIGQGDPAIGAAYQQAGFHQPHIGGVERSPPLS
jgi:hypothetical protein